MKSKKLLGLILCGLMSLSLVGCSTPLPQQVLYLKDKPPPALLLHCPKPLVLVETNEDLLELAIGLGRALDSCNDDKDSLREWAKD